MKSQFFLVRENNSNGNYREYFSFPGQFILDKNRALKFENRPQLHRESAQMISDKEVVIIDDNEE